MMEIWEEEGERDSERRDGPGDEIGSDSVLEFIRNFPMYSPPRSLTDWRADQVQYPPLDLFGLQFGYEAYLPPATTTVCNIEASLEYEASLFGPQFEYKVWSVIMTNCSQPESLIFTSCLQLLLIFTDCSQLRSLKISDCSQASLKITGCSQLESLIITGCPQLVLIITDCSQLRLLKIHDCSQASLIITGCSQLESLIIITDCSQLLLVITDCSQLRSLKIGDCLLALLRITGCSQLESLIITGCPQLSLIITDCSQLRLLKIHDCLQASLLITGCSQLESLIIITDCSELLLVITDCSQLRSLKIGDCLQASLRITGCSQLGSLIFTDCLQLRSLKISDCSQASLIITRCSQLESLIIPACSQLSLIITDCSRLESIITDCSQLESIITDCSQLEWGAKNIGQKVGSAEKSCIAISHSKKKNTIEAPKREYRTKRLITLDDLRPLFGLKRADAANIIDVSVPTFKRYCRQNGITSWNGDGCSLVEPMLVNNSVQQNSSGPKPPEVQGEKEISALLGARQDAQTFELPPGVEIIRLDSSEERIFGELGAKNIGQKVESAEKNCFAISHSKKKNTIETPKRECERLITFDDLRPHFGLKRADAAKILGVSVPTFKRCCRKNGIRWWNGDGCFPVEPKLLNNSAHQNSSGSKPPEVQGEKEISALLGARQDAVTIKAKYGEVNLKFQLSSESGFAELQEAVAKRLKSQAFTVEYEDEDQEPILIACDEDWQACVKFFGNQVIRLAIREDFQF